MGMQLVNRQEDFIEISNCTKTTEIFEILQNFPFSSESKRMGIIVRHKESDRIIFYVKGADVVMINKVKPG